MHTVSMYAAFLAFGCVCVLCMNASSTVEPEINRLTVDGVLISMQNNSKNIDFDTTEQVYLNNFLISIELNDLSCRFGKSVTNRSMARKTSNSIYVVPLIFFLFSYTNQTDEFIQ